MKVLVVHPGPHFSVSDVYHGLIKGLEQNGCEVATLNLDDRIDFYVGAHIPQADGELVKAFDKEAAMRMASQGIQVACYEYWPDVVIIVSGWFVSDHVWKVLKHRPHHTVFWATESPYEDDQQATKAQYVDTVILNDPVNLQTFRNKVNERSYYIPHSFDPDIHYPGDPDPELVCDFGFTGTGFKSRIEFLEQVDWSGIDVMLGGNWRELSAGSPLEPFLIHDREQCMPNTMTANLYRSCRASVNLYRKETSDKGHNIGWAMGPREVELAATGCFFLREPRGEGDEILPAAPTFQTPAEFEKKLRWYLTHDDEREAVIAANLEAIADRTFKNSAATLLELIADNPAANPLIGQRLAANLT